MHLKDLDLGWRRRLRSRVLKWYDANGRQLPWRESADPYRIWISEIMLQQTTVAAVVPYFDRFLQHFPDVHRLAAADQEAVLRQWEGLGYYSRARNLHKAAQVIVSERGGQFPETVDELRDLPGIGPYTAGAIASFAFNVPAGILEANTLRLYSRLIGLNIDPRGTEGQKTLWKFADWIVSRKRAADFNQAVMDIGAQVCRPVDPDCVSCPLMPSCKAFERGQQAEIPLEKKRQEMTDVVEASVAIRHDGRYLLRQRTESERWAGLWDFVRFEITDDIAQRIRMPRKSRSKAEVIRGQRSLFEDADDRQQLPTSMAACILDETGLAVSDCVPVMEIRHTVTRYRIRLLCLISDVPDAAVPANTNYRWCSVADLQQLPLSTTGRQFADRLTS